MQKPKQVTHHLRRYIVAGLLVWLPIWVTLLVIRFIVELLDTSLSLLPKSYQPQYIFGFHIPGLGILLSIVVVFLTGMLVTNFLGRKLFQFGEAIVGRIPLVRSVYNAAKQVATTLFSQDDQAFKKVFLVEYPRREMWSLAFQTGNATTEIRTHMDNDMVTLFIPTTPNPTSGFLIIVPRQEVKELKMSVDQALKLIISLGVVQPEN